MIPRLQPELTVEPVVRDFAREIRSRGFTGEVTTRYCDRFVRSTDNSLYQFVPQAVVMPRSHEDVRLLARVASDERFGAIALTARGGGTATAGHSLTTSVVVDFSDAMNRVLEIDPDARTARVQPGVVLDALNAAAGEHGLLFGPNCSTSSRATLGGMIATDAAGKGSMVYGKTSGSIIELRCVFADGAEFLSRALDDEELETQKGRNDAVGAFCREAEAIATTLTDEIERAFPKLSRYPSGYNLPMIRDNPDGRFNANYLIAGAEGTLCLVTEALLRLDPLPKRRTLVALKYASFDDAVDSASDLRPREPAAIETMDEHLLELVRGDEAYLPVKEDLESGEPPAAINLVEFFADDPDELERRAGALVEDVAAGREKATGAVRLDDPVRAGAFWTLRKRAVGLMGNLPGKRSPSAFVEDAAVPVERLSEFVRGFREILEREELPYGMYGHVDAGVVHVRPALDTTDPTDAAMLRRVSDRVAELSKRCGGVIWGEHGKGVRGEYNEMFFGPTIHGAMERLKGAADPGNRLNPGKIAAPPESRAVMLTIEASTRGNFNAQTPDRVREEINDPFRCNGNALCHNEDAQMVMCPSWKQQRDRIHTPKGRADLMREWLRQLSLAGASMEPLLSPASAPRSSFLRRWANRFSSGSDFSHQVYEAMEGCLACKACAGQCPVKVDVPSFRARFMQAYFDRYPRRVRDLLIGATEHLLPLTGAAPWTTGIARTAPMRALSRAVGLVDPPRVATPTLRRLLKGDPARRFDESAVGAGDVVVIQDAFTTYFEPSAVMATLRVARALGRDVHLKPYAPTGKPLHVKGFLREFARLAARRAAELDALLDRGATLVSIDPAATLIFRDEYPEILQREPIDVKLPQEWLAGIDFSLSDRGRAALFPHCTERAVEPATNALWRPVFEKAGIELRLVEAGCCGMCGAYGHDRDHYEHSRGIYGFGWAPALEKLAGDEEALAPGYSCRSQVERFGGRSLRHPIERLADELEGAAGASPR